MLLIKTEFVRKPTQVHLSNINLKKRARPLWEMTLPYCCCFLEFEGNARTTLGM